MRNVNQINIIEDIASLDELGPAELATLLAFLIQKERTPSGPYLLSEHPEENEILNRKVYSLFAKKNKVLKGTLSYIDSSKNRDPTPRPTAETPNTNNLLLSQSRIVHEKVHKRSSEILTPEQYEHALPTLDAIIDRDSQGEISQLNTTFLLSAKEAMAKKPTTQNLFLNGEANFYIWVAYSLYDNLLDNPHPNSIDVSTANIFHRLAITTYQEAGLSLSKINSALNTVDRANADEVSNSRFEIVDEVITIAKIPAQKSLYKLLSSRSSAHCLGLLELLNKYSPAPLHHQKTKSILNTYCAARQLSDDIHDWEEDITHGRNSYVIAHLLKAADIKEGSYNLLDVIKTIRRVFWEKELEVLTNECLSMCREAQDAYLHYFNLKPNSLLEQITLAPIMNSCLNAKKSIQFSKQFLQEIKS